MKSPGPANRSEPDPHIEVFRPVIVVGDDEGQVVIPRSSERGSVCDKHSGVATSVCPRALYIRPQPTPWFPPSAVL